MRGRERKREGNPGFEKEIQTEQRLSQYGVTCHFNFFFSNTITDNGVMLWFAVTLVLIVAEHNM